jgi:hypothetical protein
MESTTRGMHPDQQQLAFESGQEVRASADTDKVHPSVSPDSSLYPAEAVNTPEVADSVAPVWLQRLSMVIQVLFCIELGLLLAVLPWYGPVWSSNYLLADHPEIRAIIQHNFVRGVVSGLGLVDIWLGIWDAVHYHDRKPFGRR